MNLFLALVTFASVAMALVHAQEKGNSIIPFPRVGRGGNVNMIPFPRIGRSDGGHEMGKRQMIPFPRVGKRAFWHLPVPMESAYYTEYEDFNPMMEQSTPFIPSSAFAMEVAAANAQEDGEVDKRNGGQANNAGGGMWFGPRLGRKKRSTDAVSDSSAEHRESLDMKPLLKMLHNSNWAIIVPVKERRTFTPRLGRRSSNDHQIQSRAQPFSPRLGRSGEQSIEHDEDDEFETKTHFQRRSSDPTPDPSTDQAGPPFSPRLGRADPFSPRLGRADPFSPRLGRADPFSPRLGRSGQNVDDRDRD